MSISRSAFVAALMASLIATSVSADDLAASVAAKMKESGALKGYRFNVKAKAGTVWLEGTVSDARQIDAAIAAAEQVAGVERVVNRLSVPGAGSAEEAFSMPASIRSLVGLPSPAGKPSVEPEAGQGDADAAADSEAPSAERAVLEANAEVEGVRESQIALTQAVAGAPAPRQAASQRPARKVAQAGPRPFGGQSAKPVPQARRTAGGVQRTAMRSQAYGEPLDLPGSPGVYVGGEGAFEDGGYPAAGAVADGQMVPGSMRVTEGAAGGYCPPGQGGMAGPMPMGAGMRGPLGGSGGAGMGGMPVPVRGEGPNMPNYAWPSYAAYPNYAALQYPTQYSPTAWPYIGPFYPYPQVPLGWRRVSLEWDDGWWWLDFDERHIHSHHR